MEVVAVAAAAAAVGIFALSRTAAELLFSAAAAWRSPWLLDAGVYRADGVPPAVVEKEEAAAGVDFSCAELRWPSGDAGNRLELLNGPAGAVGCGGGGTVLPTGPGETAVRRSVRVT